jgi:ferredoxin-NADP reductase
MYTGRAAFGKRYTEVVLVAGGIGITPALAMLRGIQQQQQQQQEEEEEEEGQKQESSLRSSPARMPSRVHLLWVCTHSSDFDAAADTLLPLLRSAATTTTTTKAVEVSLLLHATRDKREEVRMVDDSGTPLTCGGLPYTCGRPDVHGLLGEVAARHASTSGGGGGGGGDGSGDGGLAGNGGAAAVYACGPLRLVECASDQCIELGIDFYKECFE